MLFADMGWISGLVGKPDKLPAMQAIVDAFEDTHRSPVVRF